MIVRELLIHKQNIIFFNAIIILISFTSRVFITHNCYLGNFLNLLIQDQIKLYACNFQ